PLVSGAKRTARKLRAGPRHYRNQRLAVKARAPARCRLAKRSEASRHLLHALPQGGTPQKGRKPPSFGGIFFTKCRRPRHLGRFKSQKCVLYLSFAHRQLERDCFCHPAPVLAERRRAPLLNAAANSAVEDACLSRPVPPGSRALYRQNPFVT